MKNSTERLRKYLRETKDRSVPLTSVTAHHDLDCANIQDASRKQLPIVSNLETGRTNFKRSKRVLYISHGTPYQNWLLNHHSGKFVLFFLIKRRFIGNFPKTTAIDGFFFHSIMLISTRNPRKNTGEKKKSCQGYH